MGNSRFEKFREKLAERWMHLTEIVILVGFSMWIHHDERAWEQAAILACVAIGSTIVAIIIWPRDKNNGRR